MHVLVCETDPTMLEVVGTLLESRGLSVTAVADPRQLPPVTRFDALITNCQDILNTGIPTVYMSQSQEWCDQIAARGIPALKKPFDLDKMIRLLQAAA